MLHAHQPGARPKPIRRQRNRNAYRGPPAPNAPWLLLRTEMSILPTMALASATSTPREARVTSSASRARSSRFRLRARRMLARRRRLLLRHVDHGRLRSLVRLSTLSTWRTRREEGKRRMGFLDHLKIAMAFAGQTKKKRSLFSTVIRLNTPQICHTHQDSSGAILVYHDVLRDNKSNQNRTKGRASTEASFSASRIRSCLCFPIEIFTCTVEPNLPCSGGLSSVSIYGR
jgi:hypothetical protein